MVELSAQGWTDDQIGQLLGSSATAVARQLGHARYPTGDVSGADVESSVADDLVREASARFLQDAARVLASQCVRRSA